MLWQQHFHYFSFIFFNILFWTDGTFMEFKIQKAYTRLWSECFWFLCHTIPPALDNWRWQQLCVLPGVKHALGHLLRLSALLASTWHPEGQPQMVTGQSLLSVSQIRAYSIILMLKSLPRPSPSRGRAAFGVCGLWYLQPLSRSHPQSIWGESAPIDSYQSRKVCPRSCWARTRQGEIMEKGLWNTENRNPVPSPTSEHFLLCA